MIKGSERLAMSELMWGYDCPRVSKEHHRFAADGRTPTARGGRARVLSDDQIADCQLYIRETSKTPQTDELVLLLSHFAGLRACEIAALRVDAFLDASGRIAKGLMIEERYSKSKSSRVIPIHPRLREAFNRYRAAYPSASHVTFNKKEKVFKPQNANAIAQWFRRLYRDVGLEGCSSHSGRRGFITKLARNANKYGNSLRDVQKIAGHARLNTTADYIDESEDVSDLITSI